MSAAAHDGSTGAAPGESVQDGHSSAAVPAHVRATRSTQAENLWKRLQVAGDGTFDRSMLRGLPPAAQRWLGHSISDNSPIARSVVLREEGQIRLGRWLRFTASHVVSPPLGFLWAAQTGLGPLHLSGYDRYADDAGEMRWRLFGRVPVINAEGVDIDRSDAGRLAAETFWVPTAWLAPCVHWVHSEDEERAEADWVIGPHRIRTSIRVSESGTIDEICVMRWRQPSNEPAGECPFGGFLTEEAAFDGIRIATRIRFGWFFGSDRWESEEFFRAKVLEAKFT